jgi:hypothetical protein
VIDIHPEIWDSVYGGDEMLTQTVWRIYTEASNEMQQANIQNAVERYYHAYSIIPIKGIWANQLEHSVIIEIILPTDLNSRHTISNITNIARIIKELNDQTEVLVTAHSANVAHI